MKMSQIRIRNTGFLTEHSGKACNYERFLRTEHFIVWHLNVFFFSWHSVQLLHFFDRSERQEGIFILLLRTSIKKRRQKRFDEKKTKIWSPFHAFRSTLLRKKTTIKQI
jgi:hypothetical protein